MAAEACSRNAGIPTVAQAVTAAPAAQQKKQGQGGRQTRLYARKRVQSQQQYAQLSVRIADKTRGGHHTLAHTWGPPAAKRRGWAAAAPSAGPSRRTRRTPTRPSRPPRTWPSPAASGRRPAHQQASPCHPRTKQPEAGSSSRVCAMLGPCAASPITPCRPRAHRARGRSRRTRCRGRGRPRMHGRPPPSPSLRTPHPQ
jgi:hypothetical protein